MPRYTEYFSRLERVFADFGFISENTESPASSRPVPLGKPCLPVSRGRSSVAMTTATRLNGRGNIYEAGTGTRVALD